MCWTSVFAPHLFSSDENVLVELMGTVTSSTSPDKRLSSEVLAVIGALRVEPLDERKARRLRSPGFAQKRKRLLPLYSWGQGLAIGGYRWSPCGHGLSLSQQSMPRVFV